MRDDFNQQISNIVLNEWKEILYAEAERLRKCIEDALAEWYYAYDPVMYDRDGDFPNSVDLEEFTEIKVNGDTLSVAVYFNELAHRKSGYKLYYPQTHYDKKKKKTVVTWHKWRGNGQTVNLAYLYNEGYQVQSAWFRHIAMLGFRGGTGFIEDGVAEFNSNNPYNIKVEIEFPDTYIIR